MKSALLAAVAVCAAMYALGGGDAAAADRATLKEGRKAIRPCAACHDFRSQRRKFGPNLVQVVGRDVATIEGFRYSDALKRLGGVWTEARLAEFLNDPAAYAPGNAMRFPGFKDMATARAAAAYIATIPPKE